MSSGEGAGPGAAKPDVLEAQQFALLALGWILQDQERAERLLALTGLSPQGLRGMVQRINGQAAILDFLAAHEPDLLACAIALGVDPRALARAREVLDPPVPD